MNKEDEYDVFVSYASEDIEFAEELVSCLGKMGLKVWFDQLTLNPGDKIAESIGQGMARSRYGVLILSPNFIEKDYPLHEFEGLIDKAIKGNKLLPVWHQISREEVHNFHPSVANIFAVKSDIGPENVARNLAKIIKPAEITWSRTKVKLSELKPGPIRHQTLPESHISRIKAYKAVLGEVEPISLEETIDSFRRDVHPGSEILIWEAIAATYKAAVDKGLLSFEQKKEIFSIIAGASIGTLPNTIEYLAAKEVQELVNSYKENLLRLRELS